SVTSGHNVTCFYCEVMISPLFRWPNSVCHYNKFEKEYNDKKAEQRALPGADTRDELLAKAQEFERKHKP
ncbi:hypothetical protein, partial [Klebsiella pneumoniae]|uniref:hypothetical protein n=1 Tax=Klebsiella pneumoniae TaxID=573 RepID=UPI003855F88A